jgi:ketosteroid isomerase-like protein
LEPNIVNTGNHGNTGNPKEVFMNRITLALILLLAALNLASMPVVAQTAPSAAHAGSLADTRAAQEVTKLLRDFLAAVPRGDKQVFDRFFADDVIYTRGAGVTVNKAEIMKNVGAPAAGEPPASYEADDLTVHTYGNMVIVNFRLVQHTEEKGSPVTNYFRNTGTFLKRNHQWQVVAWQATRVPAEVKQETK